MFWNSLKVKVVARSVPMTVHQLATPLQSIGQEAHGAKTCVNTSENMQQPFDCHGRLSCNSDVKFIDCSALEGRSVQEQYAGSCKNRGGVGDSRVHMLY